MSTTIAHGSLAIATALFDGLWEGALIVGAVWLGLRCLPKLGAATRYAIWLCALAALVLIPVLTAGVSERSSAPAADTAADQRTKQRVHGCARATAHRHGAAGARAGKRGGDKRRG